MKLDIDFVRNQFDQIKDDPDFVFCSNAGGSYVANQVNAVMNNYNAHTRVQPYERYDSSAQAGEAMDRAINGWAEALNISPNELTIGPSTCMNTYVMAQAMGHNWKAGDEIIVTNQDHEANSGSWRRKAEEKSVTIIEWKVDPDSGLLNPDELKSLLTDNTQWVFFTHCSNIVGTANPVKEITKLVKQNSRAGVFVDAVAYAPHHICDLKDLGVDGYAFSLYKVFGPHQSLMYIKQDLHSSLAPQCHFYNTEIPKKLFNPAGPQHAQVASCAGVLDYFDAFHEHHFNNTKTESVSMAEKFKDIHTLISSHENSLGEPILDFLHNNKNIRLIGKTHIHDNDRAPTIAFRSLKDSSWNTAAALQKYRIGCESGDYDARRLIGDLGIDPDDGVVRISLVHYSSTEEVEKILIALDTVIN